MRRHARPEGRHHIGAVAYYRHAARFQHLESLLDVEDGLGAGRHHDDRRPRQLVEIGRDVEARLGPLVDTADAAGGEDADPGARGSDHRRRDRRAAGAAFGQRKAEIRPRQLHRVARLGERLALLLRQADLQPAVDDRDRRRLGAAVADDVFDPRRHARIVGEGHAMRDDGRFQRHDWTAGRQRVGNRRVNVDQGRRNGLCHGNSCRALMPRPAVREQAPGPRRIRPGSTRPQNGRSRW